MMLEVESVDNPVAPLAKRYCPNTPKGLRYDMVVVARFPVAFEALNCHTLFPTKRVAVGRHQNSVCGIVVLDPFQERC